MRARGRPGRRPSPGRGGALPPVARGRRGGGLKALRYWLHALGAHLKAPISMTLDCDNIAHARAAAKALLAQNPKCEGVEIFSERRFEEEVTRSSWP
jgi:hypothetical protein